MDLPTAADYDAKTLALPLLGGTTKTGLAFGLPAVHTCPVISGLCQHCYAKNRGSYRFDAVKNGQLRRWAVARTSAFVPRMIGELVSASYAAMAEGQKVLRFRLHDSGDFFDCQYIESWCDIMAHLQTATPIPVAVWVPTRVWAAKTIAVCIGKSAQAAPLPLLVRLNSFKRIVARPSALRVGDPPPKVAGLAAGHGVVEHGTDIGDAFLCPVGEVNRHNRASAARHRGEVNPERREASCAALNCRRCWGSATETVFMRH